MIRAALAVAALVVTLLAADLQAQQPVDSSADAVADGGTRIDARTTPIAACRPALSGSQWVPCHQGCSRCRLGRCYSADTCWTGLPWGWESNFGCVSLAGYGWRWDHTVAARAGCRNCYGSRSGR